MNAAIKFVIAACAVAMYVPVIAAPNDVSYVQNGQEMAANELFPPLTASLPDPCPSCSRPLLRPLFPSRASAFVAPRAARASASALSMSAKDMVGVQLPLFSVFDPLGFSNTDEKTLSKYRESELKHGRVAMMAVLGVLTQDRFHPLYDGANSGNPLKAIEGVPISGWTQVRVQTWPSTLLTPRPRWVLTPFSLPTATHT